MMISGLVVELGTHGILKNFLRDHLLVLQQAPLQVLVPLYSINAGTIVCLFLPLFLNPRLLILDHLQRFFSLYG